MSANSSRCLIWPWISQPKTPMKAVTPAETRAVMRTSTAGYFFRRFLALAFRTPFLVSLKPFLMRPEAVRPFAIVFSFLNYAKAVLTIGLFMAYLA